MAMQQWQIEAALDWLTVGLRALDRGRDKRGPAAFAASIVANVDALFEQQIGREEFHVRQIDTWSAVAAAGKHCSAIVCRLIRKGSGDGRTLDAFVSQPRYVLPVERRAATPIDPNVASFDIFARAR